MSGTKKGAKTRKAKKAFREWQDNPYPIEGYNPIDGEYFVYLEMDGKSTKESTRSGLKGLGSLYVSNYGNVLEYNKKSEKLEYYHQTIDSKGYWHIKNKRSHSVIFFSFFNASKYSNRLNHERAKKEEIYTFGLSATSIYDRNTEVHHIDSDKNNNSISNLQALPKKIHSQLSTQVQQNFPNDRVELLFYEQYFRNTLLNCVDWNTEGSKIVIVAWKKTTNKNVIAFIENPKSNTECQKIIAERIYPKDMFFALYAIENNNPLQN